MSTIDKNYITALISLCSYFWCLAAPVSISEGFTSLYPKLFACWSTLSLLVPCPRLYSCMLFIHLPRGLLLLGEEGIHCPNRFFTLHPLNMTIPFLWPFPSFTLLLTSPCAQMLIRAVELESESDLLPSSSATLVLILYLIHIVIVLTISSCLPRYFSQLISFHNVYCWPKR